MSNNQYKIGILLVTILFYLLFKDVPYIAIFLSGQTLIVILAIEIILLFRLRSNTVLKISLVLYVLTIIAALLGLGLLDALAFSAFIVFIYGWLQSAVGLVRNNSRQK